MKSMSWVLYEDDYIPHECLSCGFITRSPSIYRRHVRLCADPVPQAEKSLPAEPVLHQNGGGLLRDLNAEENMLYSVLANVVPPESVCCDIPVFNEKLSLGLPENKVFDAQSNDVVCHQLNADKNGDSDIKTSMTINFIDSTKDEDSTELAPEKLSDSIGKGDNRKITSEMGNSTSELRELDKSVTRNIDDGIKPEEGSSVNVEKIGNGSEATGANCVNSDDDISCSFGKVYKCSQCSFSTTVKAERWSHMQIAHGTTRRVHRCQYCSYQSVEHNNLRRHMERHLLDAPHKCSMCTFSSTSHSAVRKHMATSHDISVTSSSAPGESTNDNDWAQDASTTSSESLKESTSRIAQVMLSKNKKCSSKTEDESRDRKSATAEDLEKFESEMADGEMSMAKHSTLKMVDKLEESVNVTKKVIIEVRQLASSSNPEETIELWTCLACGMSYKERAKVRRHVRTKHYVSMFKCPLVDRRENISASPIKFEEGVMASEDFHESSEKLSLSGYQVAKDVVVENAIENLATIDVANDSSSPNSTSDVQKHVMSRQPLLKGNLPTKSTKCKRRKFTQERLTEPSQADLSSSPAEFTSLKKVKNQAVRTKIMGQNHSLSKVAKLCGRTVGSAPSKKLSGSLLASSDQQVGLVFPSETDLPKIGQFSSGDVALRPIVGDCKIGQNSKKSPVNSLCYKRPHFSQLVKSLKVFHSNVPVKSKAVLKKSSKKLEMQHNKKIHHVKRKTAKAHKIASPAATEDVCGYSNYKDSCLSRSSPSKVPKTSSQVGTEGGSGSSCLQDLLTRQTRSSPIRTQATVCQLNSGKVLGSLNLSDLNDNEHRKGDQTISRKTVSASQVDYESGGDCSLNLKDKSPLKGTRSPSKVTKTLSRGDSGSSSGSSCLKKLLTGPVKHSPAKAQEASSVSQPVSKSSSSLPDRMDSSLKKGSPLKTKKKITDLQVGCKNVSGLIDLKNCSTSKGSPIRALKSLTHVGSESIPGLKAILIKQVKGSPTKTQKIVSQVDCDRNVDPLDLTNSLSMKGSPVKLPKTVSKDSIKNASGSSDSKHASPRKGTPVKTHKTLHVPNVDQESSSDSLCLKDLLTRRTRSSPIKAEEASQCGYEDGSELIHLNEIKGRKCASQAETKVNSLQLKDHSTINVGKTVFKVRCPSLPKPNLNALPRLILPKASRISVSPVCDVKEEHSSGINQVPTELEDESLQDRGDSSSNTMHCAHCSYSSNRLSVLRRHLLSHVADKHYSCDRCSRQYKHEWSLTLHQRHSHKKGSKEAHSEDDSLIGDNDCAQTSEDSKQNTSCSSQVSRKRAEADIPSDGVPKAKKVKHSAQKVDYTNTKDESTFFQKSISTNPPAKSSKQNMKVIMQNMKNDTSNGNSFEDSVGNEFESLQCTICSFIGETPSRLKHHMRVHAEHRKYRCPVEDCAYGSNWSCDMKKHLIKYHSDVILLNENRNFRDMLLGMKSVPELKDSCGGVRMAVSGTDQGSESNSAEYSGKVNTKMAIQISDDYLSERKEVVDAGSKMTLNSDKMKPEKTTRKLPAERYRPYQCSVCGKRSNWRWDISKHISVAHSGHHDANVILLSAEVAQTTLMEILKKARTGKIAKTQVPRRSGKIIDNGDEKVSTDFSDSASYSIGTVDPLRLRRFSCSGCAYRSNHRGNVARHIKTRHAGDTCEIDILSVKVASATLQSYKLSWFRKKTFLVASDIARKSNHSATDEALTGDNDRRLNEENELDQHGDSTHFSDSLMQGIRDAVVKVEARPPSDVLLTKIEETGYRRRIKESGTLVEFQDMAKCCDVCPFKTDRTGLLVLHKLRHRAPSKTSQFLYTCPHCPYFVHTSRQLERHIVLHDANTVARQDPIVTSTMPTVGTASNERYVCEGCPFVSIFRSEFWLHRRMHLGPGLDAAASKCKLCTFWTSDKRVMLEHTGLHSGCYYPCLSNVSPSLESSVARTETDSDRSEKQLLHGSVDRPQPATEEGHGADVSEVSGTSSCGDVVATCTRQQEEPSAASCECTLQCPYCYFTVASVRLLRQHIVFHVAFCDAGKTSLFDTRFDGVVDGEVNVELGPVVVRRCPRCLRLGDESSLAPPHLLVEAFDKGGFLCELGLTPQLGLTE